jgi:hypothetical protein
VENESFEDIVQDEEIDKRIILRRKRRPLKYHMRNY